MPATSQAPLRGAPKPFHHKSSGQAAVKIRGRFYYLGKHGSKAAAEEYQRVIRDVWGKPVNETPEGLTLAQLDRLTVDGGHISNVPDLARRIDADHIVEATACGGFSVFYARTTRSHYAIRKSHPEPAPGGYAPLCILARFCQARPSMRADWHSFDCGEQRRRFN